MKLALITDTWLPEVNGVTTVLSRMREGLRERGHTVLVVAPRYRDAPRDEEGVLRRASMPCPGYPSSRLSWPLSRRVPAALDAFEPDLVHVVTEGPIGSIGRRWALARQVPLVTSFHTDFPRYAARYLGRWAVEPVRRHLRRFHAPAAHTQTPSATTRDELAVLGVPRPVVWGRGVDSRIFTPARRDERRRASLGVDGRLVVLHVGRLAVEKDVDTMAAAFRLLHARIGSRLAFWVAGDGPRAPEVRAALPFATHSGFLPRASLADLYADADLFVFPSPTETCGLVALEAMSSGLPVTAADQGGVLENVRHGINGLLACAGQPAAFAEAVEGLAADRGMRQAMSQAARAFAVARDWERELDALVPLYEGARGAQAQALELVAQG